MGTDLATLQTASLRLSKRGIIAIRGRYRVVTPRLLAVWLAHEVWEARSEAILNQLCPALPDDLARRALLERLGHLGDTHLAKTVIDALLGRIDADFLEDNHCGEIFSILAEAAPAAGMAVLKRVFDALSQDALVNMEHSRRRLVWTLQKMAWFPEFFADAARMLLRLAEAENESYKNNATGVWASLFQVHLAPTSLPALERLSLLSETLQSKDVDRRLLALHGLRAALSTHEMGMMHGEVQAGGLASQQWRPATWEDDWAVRQAALGLLDASMQDENNGIRKTAKTILVENWVGLWRIGLLEDVWPRLKTLAPEDLEQLNELSRRLSSMLEFAEPWNVPEELQDRLRLLLAQLKGESYEERLRIAVSSRDYRPNDEIWEAFSRLALEGMQQPEALHDQLSWLFSAEAHMSGIFGAALGRADGDLRWLEALIDASLRSVNEAMLFRYMVEIGVRNGVDWVDETLDEWTERNIVTPETLVALTGRSIPTIRGAHRLIRIYEADSAIADKIDIGFIRWGQDAPWDAFEALLRIMLTASVLDVADEALMLLEQKLRSSDSTDPSLTAFVWHCLETRADLAVANSSGGYHWCMVAATMVASDPVRVAAAIMSAVNDDYVYLEHTKALEVLCAAGRRDPKGVWDVVAPKLHGDQASWSAILGLRGVLGGAIDQGVLIEWAQGNRPDGPSVVARLAPVTAPLLSPLARTLLTEFGPDEVGDELESTFISGGWCGPESEYLKGKLLLVQSWHQDDSVSVRAWADRLEVRLNQMLERAQLEEAEGRWIGGEYAY